MATLTAQSLNLFTWGNPSRGDDAIGPALHHIIKQLIAQHSLQHICLIEDFQLQPEHILDIKDSACVVFIDAAGQGNYAYRVSRVKPTEMPGYTTHNLTPGALMALYQQVRKTSCPPAFLLSVRGYFFDFGSPLSTPAKKNIALTSQFLSTLLTSESPLQRLLNASE